MKHDDWRSAAPFFEVVAAKLQGPSPGPETLAWPPNYHYGGSPFRARCPLPGTKLLGRGPARRAPFYLLLSSSPLYISSRPPTAGSIDPQISSSPFTSSPRSKRRLSIFSCVPRYRNDRVCGIIKRASTKLERDTVVRSIEPIERGITLSRLIRTTTC